MKMSLLAAEVGVGGGFLSSLPFGRGWAINNTPEILTFLPPSSRKAFVEFQGISKALQIHPPKLTETVEEEFRAPFPRALTPRHPPPIF